MTTIPASMVPVAPVPAPPADSGTDPVETSEVAASFAALLAGLVPQIAPTPEATPAAASAPSPAPADGVVPVGSLVAPMLPMAAPVATAPITELAAPTDPAPVASAGPAPVAAPIAPALQALVAEALPAAAPEPKPATSVDEAPAPTGETIVPEPTLPTVDLATPRADAARPADRHPDVPSTIAPDLATIVAAAPKTEADTAPPERAEAESVDRVDSTPLPSMTQADRPAPTPHVGATEARPAAPAPRPHTQVVNVVTPLLRRADGTYRVGLQLHPENLGRVNLDVHVVDGQVHVTMHAEHQASAEVLRSSLSELRTELEAAGVHAGRLDVGSQPGWQAPDQQRFQQQPQPFALPFDNGAPPTATADPDPSTPAATDGTLDVLV